MDGSKENFGNNLINGMDIELVFFLQNNWLPSSIRILENDPPYFENFENFNIWFNLYFTKRSVVGYKQIPKFKFMETVYKYCSEEATATMLIYMQNWCCIFLTFDSL